MNALSLLSKIDQKFCFSFLGFLLTVIFGGLSLYIEFFRDNSPRLGVQVVERSNLLTINQDMEGLKVLYENQDVNMGNAELYMISLKIENVGFETILKEYYESGSPFSLSITEGKILKVALGSTSSVYLKEAASLFSFKDRQIQMPNVILESKEFYFLRVLILGNLNLLDIRPGGKIANVNKVDVTFLEQEMKMHSFFREVFQGSLHVHILRFLIYVVIFLMIFFVFFWFYPKPIDSYIYGLQSEREAELIQKYTDIKNADHNDEFIDVIWVIFRKVGYVRFPGISRVFKKSFSECLLACFEISEDKIVQKCDLETLKSSLHRRLFKLVYLISCDKSDSIMITQWVVDLLADSDFPHKKEVFIQKLVEFERFVMEQGL